MEFTSADSQQQVVFMERKKSFQKVLYLMNGTKEWNESYVF